MSNTFCFRVVIGGIKITSDDDLFNISDALFEAGCDDGTPEVTNGTLSVSFDRESDSFENAVISAIANIESIHGLFCVSIDSGDMVSLSGAAELAGITKAALSRYANGSRGAGDFPHPVQKVDSSRPLWAWSEVAKWLSDKGQLSEDAVKQASTVEAINAALLIRNRGAQDQVNRYLTAFDNKRA
ncbi:MAG: helix-turn-helix transcriptional regulator [Plesiomonas shigelloides]